MLGRRRYFIRWRSRFLTVEELQIKVPRLSRLGIGKADLLRQRAPALYFSKLVLKENELGAAEEEPFLLE